MTLSSPNSVRIISSQVTAMFLILTTVSDEIWHSRLRSSGFLGRKGLVQGIRRHGALYPFRIGPGLCSNGICRGGLRRLLIRGYPGSSEKNSPSFLRMVKLKASDPFLSVEHALDNTNMISEGNFSVVKLQK